MSEGLPDMKIESIYEDSDHTLWIGTHDKGVVAFKEGVFQAFTVRDGLAGNGVYCIVEDEKGRLWFGTDRGLCFYYEGVLTVCAEMEGISFLWGGIRDQRGQLWFAVKGGGDGGGSVCNVIGRTATLISLSEKEGSSGGINDICEDENGILWCGGSGLYKIKENNLVEFIFETKNMIIYSLMSDNRGSLWVSADTGLYKYDTVRNNLSLVDEGMSGARSIISMTKDNTGSLWSIATDGRIYKNTENGIISVVKTEHRFWHGAAFDNVGRLWIGSYGMGLYCYDYSRFSLYEFDGYEENRRVNCLVRSRNDKLWCGVDGGFISHIEGEFELVKSGFEVTALCYDKCDILWVGARNGGIYKFDGVQINSTNSVLESYGLRVKGLVEDQNDRIWFTSFHGMGLGYYDGQETRYFEPRENADYPSWVGGIALDHKGKVWFGSASPANWNGVCYFEKNEFHLIDNISEYAILAMFAASDGCLWIGTNEGVLNYHEGKVNTINQSDGLSYDIVTAINEGRDGTLWFGTEGGGICCYDGKVVQIVQLPGGGDYNVINDIIEDENGSVWFATQGGLVRYKRRQIKPFVRINKVIADKEYDASEEIQFAVGVGNFSFHFYGWSSYDFANYLVYRYRLIGVDREWHQTRKTSVTYAQIKPGEYRFVVQSIDRDLNYSNEVEVLLTITEDLRVEGLSEALRSASDRGEFIGESRTIRQVKRQVQEVAWSDLTVLVLGETGTGKGLAVRAIHEMSERKERAFIHVNCGSVQKELFDSELFGHERGAFTGAVARKLGKFELAERGTIFLDEIGDLPLESQTRLLHVLQEKKIERVGGTQPIDVDVRVIAATNRNLIEAVREGLFRADLYYRLNVFPIEIPPLRERKEDIGLLAKYFVRHFAAHLHRQQPFVHEESLSLLRSYNWPGNVRELEHILQRAVILAGAGAIMPEHFAIGAIGGREAPAVGGAVDEIVPLEEFERRYFVKVLKQTQGVIQGKNGAAELLGLKPTTLRSRLDRLGVEYRKPHPLN